MYKITYLFASAMKAIEYRCKISLRTYVDIPIVVINPKSGMNSKTLHYIMGHSEISVNMNVYTHTGFDGVEEKLKRIEAFRKAQAEVEKKNEKPYHIRCFRKYFLVKV